MKKMKRFFAGGIAGILAVGMLAGCGGSGSASSGSSGAGAGSSDGELGRYVEENYGFPVSEEDSEDSGSSIIGLTILSDGTVRSLVNSYSYNDSEMTNTYKFMDSKDGGKTWEDSSVDLASLDIFNKKAGSEDYGYINNVTWNRNGDMFFDYDVTKSAEEDRDDGHYYIYDETHHFYILSADGQLKELNVELDGFTKSNHNEYRADDMEGEDTLFEEEDLDALEGEASEDADSSEDADEVSEDADEEDADYDSSMYTDEDAQEEEDADEEAPEEAVDVDDEELFDADEDDGAQVIDMDEENDGIVINDGSEDMGDYGNENTYFEKVVFSDDDLYLFSGAGQVYHVSVSEDAIKNTISDFSYVVNAAACGDKLVVSSWDASALYDIKSGKKVKDLDSLTEQIMNARGSLTYTDSDDSDKLYYLSNDGIFSYSFESGENTMIVDGALTSMTSPNASMERFIVKPDNEYLVVLYDYSDEDDSRSLLNYKYDPDMPAKPDNMIKVYSLNDDYIFREAAAVFQKTHPDTYVKFEVGITGDDAVTMSDAVRTLNTEIMAGNGPDVIILDGLPVQSYVEKGLLLDISDVTGSLTKDGKVFEKVINTYSKDGKVYAVPTSFSVPMIVGHKEDLDKITDMESLTAFAKEISEGERSKTTRLMNEYEISSLIGTFIPTNADGWFKDDKTINSEALTKYIENVKDLSKYAINSLTEEEQKDYAEMMEYYNDEEFMNEISADWFMGSDPTWEATEIVAGASALAMGNVSGSYGIEYLYSAAKADDSITYKSLPGTLSNVYIPGNTLGINSKSENADASKEFVKYMLDEKIQKSIAQYNGFPVNIAAFDASMVDPNKGEDYYKEGEAQGSIGSTDKTGKEYNMDIYWPTDEYIAQFKDVLMQVENPAYNDNTILTTIIKDCMPCINNDTDAGEAVDQVVKDINIYLSE